MDTVTTPTTGDPSLIKVKQETKRVLEAFLTRSLNQDEGKRVGHVGRTYHDPKKYSHRNSHDESRDGTVRKAKKSERKKNKDSGKDHEENLDELTQERNGKWNAIHEEIRRVEDAKLDFRKNIKKLLRKDSHPKDKAATERNGSTHSKSRDSIEALLDDHGKGVAKRDSMKRPKSPNPLLACTVASSSISLEEEQKQNEVGPHEKHVSHGAQKKSSKPFSLKKLLKKKQKEIASTDPSPSRPDFLPVTPCYDQEYPSHPEKAVGKIEDSEIYNLAAKKLETLIKLKKVRSPSIPEKFPETINRRQSPKIAVHVGPDNNNVTTNDRPPVEDKEEVIQKLVALLQEQAVVINEQINKDPFLRNALSRMSYGSFSRLAEVFTSQAEVVLDEVGAVVSPELTKIALTMELTRKVAGINSHTVHTLMGYSLQYMDMFVPWLQKQGGWENIVSNGDIADLQID